MVGHPLSLSDREYERFHTLILERSGLHFPEKRQPDLERGLQRTFSQSGCPDLEAYYRLLADNDTDGRVWEQLICHLTVGETYFFRDQAQFEALQYRVLPELIARKRSRSRQLRIWSAGCASGEEPYSIAMLLRDLLPDLNEWNITILASDINRESLARARAGLYGKWSFREKGWARMRASYFARQGNLWQLSREVRDMVSFAYLNLVEDPYPSLANNTIAFDVILCRNVTIYFTAEITRRVVDQFYEALLEGGWLVVGHSEPSLVTYAQFEPRNFPGAVLYQKTGNPAPIDLSWLESLDAPRPAASPRARSGRVVMPVERVIPSLVTTSPESAPVSTSLYAQATRLLEQVEQDCKRLTASVLTSSPPVEAPLQEVIRSPADLCAEAAALLEQSRTAEARERIQLALEHDPGNALACYLMGKSLADGGRWGEARQWCERALGQNRLLTEAHFLLGLVHSQEGDIGQALGAMKRVIYLDRNAVLGHYWLANLYSELGNQDRAQKSLENTLRLLEGLPTEASIPWSDGMTAGRLRYIVRRQMNGQLAGKEKEERK